MPERDQIEDALVAIQAIYIRLDALEALVRALTQRIDEKLAATWG